MPKFVPNNAKKPMPVRNNNTKKESEPSVDVGRYMFYKSLINLPFRALKLEVTAKDGSKVKLEKAIVDLINEIPFIDLYDIDNPAEIKNLEYSINRFQTSIQTNPSEFFKKSAELFIASFE